MTTAETSSDVLDLVHRWAAAERLGDAGLLDGLLAGDFVGVGPLGFVLTRDQWLGRFGGGLENRAFAVEEPQVHNYGSAAIVVGVQLQQTSVQGRDNAGRFRVTLAAACQAGRWLLTSVRIGPLQSPPPPSP